VSVATSRYPGYGKMLDLACSNLTGWHQMLTKLMVLTQKVFASVGLLA
jgi:hypothetical protein